MPQAKSIRTTDPDTIEVIETLQAEQPDRYRSLSKALGRIVRDWSIYKASENAKESQVGQHIDVTA